MDETILTPAEKMGRVVERLREENARLRGYMRPDQIEEAETVAKVIRERDEARAEARHLKECNDGHPTMCCGQCASQIKEAKAEVSRLEGLILDWDEAWKGYPDAQNADLPLLVEARRIRAQREEGRVSYIGEVEPT